MPTITDAAVVLMRLDYSETSQVLAFYTRGHGKVRAIAKGIKRGTKTRFAAAIDLFEVGQLTFIARPDRAETLATITEWRQSLFLAGLRETLPRWHAAQYLVDITGRLTEEGDADAQLYEALVVALTEIAAAEEVLGHLVSYQRRLLESAGTWPRLDGCVLCGRTSELTHFSSFEGGLVCRHCEIHQIEKIEVYPDVIKSLISSNARKQNTAATAGNPSDATAVTSSTSWTGAFALLNYHLSHLMGRESLLAAKLIPRPGRRVP